MRKLVVFCHMSLDGIAAIKSGDLSWVAYDKDLEKWADQIVDDTDTTVYGHTTFELMKYWQTVSKNPKASKRELNHARWIENVEKIVISKTIKKPDWNNTQVIKDNIVEEITKLKEQSGKDITIFGSPTTANMLINLGLVDEYQLSISPIVLGSGTYLFKDMSKSIKMKLVEKRAFKSGLVTLHYVAK